MPTEARIAYCVGIITGLLALLSLFLGLCAALMGLILTNGAHFAHYSAVIALAMLLGLGKLYFFLRTREGLDWARWGVVCVIVGEFAVFLIGSALTDGRATSGGMWATIPALIFAGLFFLPRPNRWFSASSRR